MSVRRKEILRELGLTPLWQLRHRVSAVAQTGKRDSTPNHVAAAARVDVMDWSELKTCVASCQDCTLHAKRTQTVFGVGDEKADWLFIGEGPGAEEDARGEPFVGQAGKLLDNMLRATNLRRGENV